MKRIYQAIIATIIFSTNLWAQPTFSWAKSMGGANQDFGLAVAVDGSGNVYSTGYFQGTVDFNPGVGVFNLTSLGGNDLFISKLDASGNFVWVKQIGGTYFGDEGRSITTDIAGNVYLTGTFGSTVDFDPNAGVFNMSAGSGDGFILKLTGAGNFVFARELGNGVNPVYPYSIALDATGNIYTTGMFWSTSDFDPGAGTFNMTPVGGLNDEDVFISKLSSAGNFVWAKQLGGMAVDYGFAITVDASNNVYTTGYFNGTADFNPGAGIFNMTSFGTLDIFVSKLDVSGNFVWAKQIGGTAQDFGYGISVDGSGNVYTTGGFQGTSDFDPSGATYNLTSLGGNDVFISKLDASGNFVFAKQLGGTSGDGGNKICLDTYGNIYTVGNFASPATDFDPGAGTFTIATAGSNDVFMSKLDVNGNFVWAGSMGGPSADVGNAIAVDPNGNIYTAGTFASTLADFDAGANTYTLSTVNQQDIFVTKYCQIPIISSSIGGLNSMCAGAGASNYSIAAVIGATSYTWSLPGGWTGSSVTNTISATSGATGVFSVTASNGCGTSPQQTLNVTVNPLPTITVNNGAICSGNSFTMVPSGANTYTFSSGSSVVSPTATTSYSVTGTSIAGCIGSNTAVASVTVNSIPVASANTTQTLTCTNTTVTLNGSGVTTYTWSGPGIVSGGNSATPTANMPGTYSLVGTTSGCVSNTATVTLTSNTTTPFVWVTSSVFGICVGNTATLNASGADTYTWNTASTATQIVVSPTATTIYTLSGTTTSNGCTGVATKTLYVYPLPTISATTSNSIICGPPFQGTATITANGASTYTWNTTATTTAIAVSPSVTTSYTVTGTDANSCVSSSVFSQSVSACTGVNQIAFTPNEINIYPNPFNDKITVVSNGEKQSVQIFNMLGSLIRSTVIENEKTEIDLSNQSNGIYFIRIDSVTKKIIKN